MSGYVVKIVCMPTQCYDALSRKSMKRFVGILYVEFYGVCNRKWNSERVIFSQSVTLKCAQGVNNSAQICKRILFQLDLWNCGAFDELAKYTYSLAIGYLEKYCGIQTEEKKPKEKYLSSQRGSEELIWAGMGGGTFSNADHLWRLGEERRDGKKDWEVANKTKLKGLVQYLKGNNMRLLLQEKSTIDWMSVCGTTVSGTVLSSMKFRDFLCAS